MDRGERRHLVTGIAMAAASGSTIIPLVASIKFGGSTSTPRNYPTVTGAQGNVYSNVSGEYFELASSGGVGSVTLSYEVTANVGQGFCTNPAQTSYGQAGTTLTTAQIMTMGWAVDALGNLLIGQSASATVRCKAVDGIGTIAVSPTITVSVTRTT
jgi:hypothetical protein